ncbi:MAG: T9SS type A sorting domain-containing protein, partial [bacterium]
LLKDDNRLIQQNYFAYENEYGSGNWKPFTSITGNPAYSYLNHAGTIHGYNTFTRGSFVPMLRIYMNGSHYQWKEKPNDVKDFYADELFKITPNPASEYIEINIGADSRRQTADGEMQGDIHVFNILGQCVSNLTLNSSYTPLTPLERGFRIDVSGLPEGMYFVRIADKINKFIK